MPEPTEKEQWPRVRGSSHSGAGGCLACSSSPCSRASTDCPSSCPELHPGLWITSSGSLSGFSRRPGWPVYPQTLASVGTWPPTNAGSSQHLSSSAQESLHTICSTWSWNTERKREGWGWSGVAVTRGWEGPTSPLMVWLTRAGLLRGPGLWPTCPACEAGLGQAAGLPMGLSATFRQSAGLTLGGLRPRAPGRPAGGSLGPQPGWAPLMSRSRARAGRQRLFLGLASGS